MEKYLCGSFTNSASIYGIPAMYCFSGTLFKNNTKLTKHKKKRLKKNLHQWSIMRNLGWKHCKNR